MNQNLEDYVDQDGFIRSNHFKSGVKATVFIGVITAFMLVTPFYFDRAFYGHFFGVIWALILLAGFLRSFYGVYKRRKSQKHFGEVKLKIKPLPGVIGKVLSGEVFILKNYLGLQFSVELMCVFHYEEAEYGYSQRPSHRTRHMTKTVWTSGKKKLSQKSSDMGVCLPFEFDVPKGLPESSREVNSYHQWTVRLASGMSRVKLDRSFVIPVSTFN